MPELSSHEIPAIAVGPNGRDTAQLALPYYFDDDRLVVPAAHLVDSLHERPFSDKDNVYIALGNIAAQQNTEIIFGGGLCKLDLHRHELHVDGNNVDLTPLEFSLLNIHARNLDKVVPIDYSEELLWGDGISDRWVDSPVLRHISHIRQQLNKFVPGLGNRDSGALRVISNVGHMLCSDYLDMNKNADTEPQRAGISVKRLTYNQMHEGVQPTAGKQEKLFVPDSSIMFAGGAAVLNTVTQEVTTHVNTTRLSTGEVKFLNLLATNLGKFVSSKTLAGELWGIDETAKAANRINSVIRATRLRLNIAMPGLGHPDKGAIITIRHRGCILLDELES